MDSNEVASAFQNDSLGSDDAFGIAEKIKNYSTVTECFRTVI